MPVIGWIGKVWKYDAESYRYLGPHRFRLVVSVVLVMASLGYLSTANSPFARRVPVVVRFCEEQIARAQADAFVDQVFVRRGQRVVRGTLLVQLRAPELKLRRDELADDCRMSRMREVQFRHAGELAKAAAESERTESLKRQLAELDDEVASLRIVATRPGLVTGAEIENLEGSFVEEGQQLLCVCDPQEKELLVAVTTPNVEAYNLAVAKQQATSIRLRGGKSLMAKLPPLRPRASQSLPHPALGANVGGPLPVQSSTDDAEMQSAVPLMQSVALLDPLTSVEVQAGQVGMMRISDNRSLLDRVIESVWK
jgi:putative peptide zinc metalloprotease protein